ncbi:hypothetical protein EYF80_062801 [Liparis tanakae]|uniref:Uncharacterized protein n=1 Tax=Liparis tanakae TaxID=230148 RepID=A0A4Z2EE68_9TELE|nr:hypothetical protein EYF80_062801 [Liparis tanakae]
MVLAPHCVGRYTPFHRDEACGIDSLPGLESSHSLMEAPSCTTTTATAPSCTTCTTQSRAPQRARSPWRLDLKSMPTSGLEAALNAVSIRTGCQQRTDTRFFIP